ncbi:hypothetical protein K1T71_011447 [Dendrolimus kikuchii]|uniref:Uncharacterized protein n=1 Tax=Dendrolimus kikuchii TaxID=765133 RepID=A0ACC1CP84_9NEOP|nr:hypothetical protein K1T71_011447 [Dendrolimus kikuchii]
MNWATSTLLLLAWAMPSHEQKIPRSPCPNVFNYEPLSDEREIWYGSVRLTTDSTLRSFWLNIVLDSKANLIGNWIGEVTTQDNMDFKIESKDMQINPNEPANVRFYVRYNPTDVAPKLKSIKLNGREICNVDRLETAVDRFDNLNRQGVVQTSPKPTVWNMNSPGTQQKPKRPRPDTSVDLSLIWPDVTTPPSRQTGRNTIYTSPNTKPNTLTAGPPMMRFFTGGLPIIYIANNNNDNGPHQCGRVVPSATPLVANGKPTKAGQWPWQVALYHAQTVDYKYICGGTLVTRRHVITAAHCVTLPGSRTLVDPKTLNVHLGKYNLKFSEDGTQVKLVQSIKFHPLYNETYFLQDLAILELKDKVTYNDRVQPACLWPDDQVDLENVIGVIGSVVGWGFDETGVSTEELNLAEMPVIDTNTCLRSNGEFFIRFTSDYTYCAGYRDGTAVCNGDSGSGMVFKMDNSWYLRGLVSVAVARPNEYQCDPSQYVIFTDVAKLLPWIKENINYD